MSRDVVGPPADWPLEAIPTGSGHFPRLNRHPKAVTEAREAALTGFGPALRAMLGTAVAGERSSRWRLVGSKIEAVLFKG